MSTRRGSAALRSVKRAAATDPLWNPDEPLDVLALWVHGNRDALREVVECSTDPDAVAYAVAALDAFPDE